MNIAIVGLGLIGGSIALGLKAKLRDIYIIGIPRREETIQEALALKAIDEGTTNLKQGAAKADIIFVCTPINLVVPIVQEMADCLKPGTIVTDVASTKAGIVAQASKLLPKGVFFIGGHPMAGKEKVKLVEAEAALFQDKPWILIRNSKTNQRALSRVAELAVQLGGKTMEMDAKTHDLAVAGISHTPLAIAAALVNSVQDAPKAQEQMKACAASGFRDTTRIASGDPVLGVDMFTTNKKAVLEALAGFKKALVRLEKLIKAGAADGIEKELERAKKFRDLLYG
ncbi:MAG: prephenate dehydrogenase/arogenate dehydrogenase family protein [Candidatus Saganbacteria bacterium]|nr:prephenate dehydrogenase/arogenate dehydrogenase family protein [Candidatus Saganbacteria bacterium]